MEELLRSFDEEYVIRLLRNIIKIPSVVGEEDDLAEFIKNEISSLGFETRFQKVDSKRQNVIGSYRFGPGKTFMYNGHLDTAPVCEGWSTDPFEPVVKDGKLHGLGSLDMKGGMAAIIGALKAILDAGIKLQGALVFSGVVGEEGYSEGARSMMKSELAKVDAILIGESQNVTSLGITGKVLYELTVKGKSAHGFHPQEGINAVEEAARIIVSLNKLNLKTHPKFGKGTVCTLKVQGGYERYSIMVPGRCTVEINRLIVPGESSITVISDMQSLVNQLGLSADVEVRTRPPYYEPFEIDPEEAIVKVFAEAYSEVRGTNPQFGYNVGITDANVFAGEGGIPTIHHGPHGQGAHQANEFVQLQDLKPTALVDALTAIKFLR